VDKLKRAISVAIALHSYLERPRVFLMISVCAAAAETPGPAANCLPALNETMKRPLTFAMLSRNDMVNPELAHALCILQKWEVSGRVAAAC
jgi:hypothetical protein